MGDFDYLCTQISVSWKETNGYCSTKTHNANRQKDIIKLPRSVTKGLVACRDTTLGVSS